MKKSMVSQPPRSPRVMIDTSVLLPGIIWPRWGHEILQHALKGDFQLVLSNFLIDEATRKFTEKFPSYADGFAKFLQDCDFELVPDPSLEEIEASHTLMQDIMDVPIALAAINARVDYFISQDKHFTQKTAANAKLHDQLTIMLSGTFLRQVMDWSSEDLERVRQRTIEDLKQE